MKKNLLTITFMLFSVLSFAQVDIAVQSVNVTPQSGYKGDYFYADAVCANPGTVAVNSFIVNFYVSTSSPFNANNATMVGTAYGSGLSVGSKVSVEHSFLFPTSVSNTSTTTWYVWAEIVSRGAVESNAKQANNTKSGTVTIYGSSF